MSEPLSKVFQFKRKPSPTYFPANEGYNLCLDELDQLSPDVNTLQKIIMKYVDLKNLQTEMAQEIINKMNVWVVKESSGQCNHEFMQQYDFSKFSNAGNSLKCVKCGLIKKG